MMKIRATKTDWFIDAERTLFIFTGIRRYVVKTHPHQGAGVYAGIAVNPDTSVASITEILNLCDYVMVMTVNPGFAGQGGFIDFTTKKSNSWCQRLKKNTFTS